MLLSVFLIKMTQANCHAAARGPRNEETRIITNRVFNVEQMEETETQVRTSIQAST